MSLVIKWLSFPIPTIGKALWNGMLNPEPMNVSKQNTSNNKQANERDLFCKKTLYKIDKKLERIRL